MRSASRVILGVTSNLMINETFVVLHVFSSFNRREVNGVNIHGIGILSCPRKEGPNAASSSESGNSLLLSMEFACLFNPFVQHSRGIFDWWGHLSQAGV